jgi:hypothetical protein
MMFSKRSPQGMQQTERLELATDAICALCLAAPVSLPISARSSSGGTLILLLALGG